METSKIIELKVNILNSLQSVGMTWWASSCVLCASIIAAVWTHRDTLAKLPLMTSLRAAIGFFFLSIVAFGLFMTVHVASLEHQVSALTGGAQFATDFTATSIAFGIATSSFILATVAWFRLVHTFSRKPVHKPQSK